jgi:hypothetical protein
MNRGWNKELSSRAVVCMSKDGHGCVLHWVGADLHNEISDAGFTDLGDLGLDDAPVGISIWEGRYRYWQSGAPFDPPEYNGEAKGTFRAPTDEEWTLLRSGAPWNENDWAKEE